MTTAHNLLRRRVERLETRAGHNLHVTACQGPDGRPWVLIGGQGGKLFVPQTWEPEEWEACAIAQQEQLAESVRSGNFEGGT